MTRLGIEVAADPRWFYGLCRTDQRDVLAIYLPPLRKARRPRAPDGRPLSKQVTEGSDMSWLFEGD